jgi:hypothetical protein
LPHRARRGAVPAWRDAYEREVAVPVGHCASRIDQRDRRCSRCCGIRWNERDQHVAGCAGGTQKAAADTTSGHAAHRDVDIGLLRRSRHVPSPPTPWSCQPGETPTDRTERRSRSRPLAATGALRSPN